MRYEPFVKIQNSASSLCLLTEIKLQTQGWYQRQWTNFYIESRFFPGGFLWLLQPIPFHEFQAVLKALFCQFFLSQCWRIFQSWVGTWCKDKFLMFLSQVSGLPIKFRHFVMSYFEEPMKAGPGTFCKNVITKIHLTFLFFEHFYSTWYLKYHKANIVSTEVRVVIWFEALSLSPKPGFDSCPAKPLENRPKTTSVPSMR